MYTRPTDIPTEMAKVLMDAHQRFGDVHRMKVVLWEQTWPDTSCGFGGMAGQSFTDAYTVVLVGSKIHVYHGGRYAYSCEPDGEARKCLSDHRFPGRAEPKKGLTLVEMSGGGER